MRRLFAILIIIALAGAVVLYPSREHTYAQGNAEKSAPQFTPVPTATPVPTPTPEPTPVPTPTPEPTPTPYMVKTSALYEGVNDGKDSNDVKRLQNRLNELGYFFGAIDGKFGPGTANAVKYFQKVNGLEVTGVADFRTIDYIYSEDAIMDPAPTPTPMAQGVQGDDVKALQEKLILYGFLTGDADGNFGQKTEAAVKLAQEYVKDMLERRYKAYPTPSPAPTSIWITPSPTPRVTPTTKVNPSTGMTELDFTVMPTPTPTLSFGPSATPWEADGTVSGELLEALNDKNFETCYTDVKNGDRGTEVKRIQNRLVTLGYLRSADGVFGAQTERALKYFQSRNALPQTGKGNRNTLLALYSTRAKGSDTIVTEYKITVSTAKQKVYVYKWNGQGFDSKPVKTFKCSTGMNDTPTPKGTFWNTGRIGGEWYYFKDFDCWARYAWVIDGGVLFHSVIYSSNNVNSLRSGTVRQLGKKASHGCVRLAVENAKWIYDNCSAGTPVTVE
ncbi:MAG: L,D-transpeptidase family protein [Clostridiales bacterium]|nr:L,D-transpeptidase family protein [Clostridiales bacterium]